MILKIFSPKKLGNFEYISVFYAENNYDPWADLWPLE
jgi:hypothetical protein